MHPPEQLQRWNARHRLLQQLQVATKHLAVQAGKVVAQLALVLAHGHAEQAHEHPEVAAAPADLQRQRHQQFEQLLERGRLALAALQLALEALAERPEKTDEYRLDQRVLGAEVIIDRRQVDPRLGGDQTQRGLGEALLGKQLLRRVENPFNCCRLNHDHSISQTSAPNPGNNLLIRQVWQASAAAPESRDDREGFAGTRTLYILPAIG
ncbi:hypothetical protein D3C81_1172310 [compost metagenome]